MLYIPKHSLSFQEHKAAIILYNENMAAITMIQALVATKRSVFIDLHLQYLKEYIGTNTTIHHQPSRLLSADVFSEPLERQRLQEMRDLIEFFEITDIDQDIMTHSTTGVQGACERRSRATLSSTTHVDTGQ